MKCPICRHGEMQPGTTSLTLERNNTTVVFRQVPAQICNICGEAFHDAAITSDLLKQAELASAAGVEVDVRRYALAA
jgi:YgiT-type zinc finger domain-containing protein